MYARVLEIFFKNVIEICGGPHTAFRKFEMAKIPKTCHQILKPHEIAISESTRKLA